MTQSLDGGELFLNSRSRFKNSNAVKIISNSTIEYNKDYSSRSKEKEKKKHLMEDVNSLNSYDSKMFTDFHNAESMRNMNQTLNELNRKQKSKLIWKMN